ncbi:MAG: hypothetical protein ABJN69_03555 [Hellea sp.]
MPKLTKLTIAATAIMLAITPAAFAQDNTLEHKPEAQIVDIFASADVDGSGALDRDEFISFVVMKSDTGDTDYKAIKISGEYDNHFNTKDYNADGLLTSEELTPPVKEPSKHIVKPEMEAPVDKPG